MLYYITHAHIPNEKAFGYAVAKMCSILGVHTKVTLVMSGLPKGNAKDIFSQYDLPQNFSIKILPSLNLYGWRFLGNKIPFAIKKISFLLSQFFLLRIQKGDICYSRDLWSSLVSRLKTSKAFWEIHHISGFEIVTLSCLRPSIGCIAITEYLKKRVVAVGYRSQDVLVSPSGADVGSINSSTPVSKRDVRRNLGLAEDDVIVGYVGKYKTMGEPKGVEDLICAFPKILTHNTKAFLLLVGIDTHEYAEVESIFARLAIPKDRYTVVSHVPHHVALTYMQASDVLVMNYPDTPHYRDVMSPIKLFEYMASGVPIVTSDLPSIREILSDDDAFFFKAGSRDAVSESALKCLSDRHTAEVMAKRAFERVKQYSWEKRATLIQKYIEQYGG
ncbi:MAG: hypothetical protein RLZZ347_457 [Candidatus Parcubacteria bacterium]|jgi:glycosyltransferase involved in cell wall biosynthesis